MGSGGSKKKKLNETLEEEYVSIGLPKLTNEDFKNDLEREIYVAINMIRYNPTRMSKLMNPLKNMDCLSKNAKKSVDKVKKILKKLSPTAPLALYSDGSRACLEINEKFFNDEEEYKANKKNLVIDAEGTLIKTLEETKKGIMKVAGSTRVITDITDETGALVVLGDFCEWIGAGNDGVPPYLESKNKKLGVNVHPVGDKLQVASLILVEDFFNSMI
eukprot:CAMPEP_0168336630 /NCGR_PEP_ID=MMETSP0213-20121227/11669_1 /TAXON_ID=151035 /ORGANISM="Euplotes harpa, Strain FSP1.4" /LENGTH=216 /DNA_ID=CAMNT_0008341885 /DNA_START=22 /DNA_END=672 /DNA_ORIENTATION=-